MRCCPQVPGSACALQGVGREVPARMTAAVGGPSWEASSSDHRVTVLHKVLEVPEYGGSILLYRKVSPP